MLGLAFCRWFCLQDRLIGLVYISSHIEVVGKKQGLLIGVGTELLEYLRIPLRMLHITHLQCYTQRLDKIVFLLCSLVAFK